MMDKNSTDEKIKKILARESKRKEYIKQYYSIDENKEKRREHNRTYYKKNSDYHIIRYEKNKDFIKSRSKWNYYKKKGEKGVNKFKNKFPTEVEVLRNAGILIN